MHQNIPLELRQLPQWVVADMSLNDEGEPKKIPINARTGQPANVCDRTTWSTYEQVRSTGSGHIGFVLAATDPYSIIDLDEPQDAGQVERHNRILDLFPTYAEVSQSGNGVHLVMRGAVPHGARRDGVEVYSHARYMIMTGDVLNNLPVAECQPMLDTLWSEMGYDKKAVGLVEHDETTDDTEVVATAEGAENGALFLALWQGKWEDKYPSQSEADFALMDMLGFYSKSNEQCRRLFQLSELGKRAKASRRKYLDYMLAKIRAEEPDPVDLKEFMQRVQSAQPGNKPGEVSPQPLTGLASSLKPILPPPPGAKRKGLPPPPTKGQIRQSPLAMLKSPAALLYEYPPGLIGELAAYYHETAIRPVREVALVSALATVAGICGRSFNISGSGLNQYIILLALTGTGKDGLSSGIESMVAAVRYKVPAVDQFIGPAKFASGQALTRALDKQPCFVSVLGEFGHTLKQVCDPRAPHAVAMLKSVMLDAFNRSGWNKVLRPSVYSDTEKNTAMVQAPNITLLGESTPDVFYGQLGAAHVLEGLIPRFTVVEYNGKRPPRNPNAFGPPSEKLVEKMADLAAMALTTAQNNVCAPVAINPEGQAMLDAFDKLADKQINDGGNDVDRQLWNRAHLKALKLAALVAVGINLQSPVVDAKCARWAIDFVERETRHLVEKFQKDEVGEGEGQQESDLRRAVEMYLQLTKEQREKAQCPQALLDQPYVPYHYLRRWCRQRSSFKLDRRGTTVALQTLLDDLARSGALLVLNPATTMSLYHIKTPVYAQGPTW